MGNKLKAVFSKLGAQLSDIWEKEKILLIAIVFILLAIKFRELWIAAIVLLGKRLFNSTQKATDALQKEENAANDAANKLVDDAKNIPDAPTPGDGWNK